MLIVRISKYWYRQYRLENPNKNRTKFSRYEKFYPPPNLTFDTCDNIGLITQTDRFFETGQFERRSSLVNRISLVEADCVGN